MKVKNFFLFVFIIQVIFCNKDIACFGGKDNYLKVTFKNNSIFCCCNDNCLGDIFKKFVYMFNNKNRICDELLSNEKKCEQFISDKIKPSLNAEIVVDFMNYLNDYLDFDNDCSVDQEKKNKENFYSVICSRIDKSFLDFLKNKNENMDFLLKKYDIENNFKNYKSKEFIEKEKMVYNRILVARDIIRYKIQSMEN